MQAEYKVGKSLIYRFQIIVEGILLTLYHPEIAAAGRTCLRFMRSHLKSLGHSGVHQRTDYIKRIISVGKNPLDTFQQYIGEIARKDSGNMQQPPVRGVGMKHGIRYFRGKRVDNAKIIRVDSLIKKRNPAHIHRDRR